jgi:hypothetical protein
MKIQDLSLKIPAKLLKVTWGDLREVSLEKGLKLMRYFRPQQKGYSYFQI